MANGGSTRSSRITLVTSRHGYRVDEQIDLGAFDLVLLLECGEIIATVAAAVGDFTQCCAQMPRRDQEIAVHSPPIRFQRTQCQRVRHLKRRPSPRAIW